MAKTFEHIPRKHVFKRKLSAAEIIFRPWTCSFSSGNSETLRPRCPSWKHHSCKYQCWKWLHHWSEHFKKKAVHKYWTRTKIFGRCPGQERRSTMTSPDQPLTVCNMIRNHRTWSPVCIIGYDQHACITTHTPLNDMAHHAPSHGLQRTRHMREPADEHARVVPDGRRHRWIFRVRPFQDDRSRMSSMQGLLEDNLRWSGGVRKDCPASGFLFTIAFNPAERWLMAEVSPFNPDAPAHLRRTDAAFADEFDVASTFLKEVLPTAAVAFRQIDAVTGMNLNYESATVFYRVLNRVPISKRGLRIMSQNLARCRLTRMVTTLLSSLGPKERRTGGRRLATNYLVRSRALVLLRRGSVRRLFWAALAPLLSPTKLPWKKKTRSSNASRPVHFIQFPLTTNAKAILQASTSTSTRFSSPASLLDFVLLPDPSLSGLVWREFIKHEIAETFFFSQCRLRVED